MNKPIISKEWTAEERLSLIAWITDSVLSATNTLRMNHYHLHQRLYFIATMPAEFLEKNKDQITSLPI